MHCAPKEGGVAMPGAEVTVTLAASEARALCRTAGLWSRVLDEACCSLEFGTGEPPALVAAQAKLEVALALAGERVG